jgi:hypothetical protein
MTNNIYKYCLLQYRHSQFLGEVLNVGVLVYYPSVPRLVFLKPEKLIRLKFTYPNVQEKTIKTYFKAFDERVESLNTKPELFSEIDSDGSFIELIRKEFLPLDASSLQFADIKKSIQFTSKLEVIENQLYNLYFSVFEHNISNYNRIDESHLLSKYKNLIKELDREAYSKENKKLHFDYEIKPKEGESFKFDIGWENGSLNLVKPVSFDVVRNETIQNKAYKFYGQFLDLQGFAGENNLRFDLLIAKPKKKELFKTFDNAIRLLSKPKHVKLVESDDLLSYTKKTINAISLFDDGEINKN